MNVQHRVLDWLPRPADIAKPGRLAVIVDNGGVVWGDGTITIRWLDESAAFGRGEFPGYMTAEEVKGLMGV